METPEQAKPETGLQAIKSFLNSEGIQKRFEQMLGSKTPQFITSIMQIISKNKQLQNADIASIYNAAATAAIVDLPLNNNLQFACIVPYFENGVQMAQFQMQYRGYIQLAQRSGKVKTINVTDVRQGELKTIDRKTGICIFEWIDDEEKRLTLPIVGWLSYFNTVNGFEKEVYWPVAKIKAHGLKYSKTFQKGNGRWITDFDAMCAKTVLKENISKYSPLSIETSMAVALQADDGVIKKIDGTEIEVDYVDNPVQYAEELTEEEAAEIERKTREEQAKQGMSNIEQNMFEAAKNAKADKKK